MAEIAALEWWQCAMAAIYAAGAIAALLTLAGAIVINIGRKR